MNKPLDIARKALEKILLYRPVDGRLEVSDLIHAAVNVEAIAHQALSDIEAAEKKEERCACYESKSGKIDMFCSTHNSQSDPFGAEECACTCPGLVDRIHQPNCPCKPKQKCKHDWYGSRNFTDGKERCSKCGVTNPQPLYGINAELLDTLIATAKRNSQSKPTESRGAMFSRINEATEAHILNMIKQCLKPLDHKEEK